MVLMKLYGQARGIHGLRLSPAGHARGAESRSRKPIHPGACPWFSGAWIKKGDNFKPHPRVFVAMSGGRCAFIAVALLKKQG